MGLSFGVRGGIEPAEPAELSRMFDAGDYDYLPDVVPDYLLNQLGPVTQATHPSDRMLPNLPDAIVEDLAQQNLDDLTMRRLPKPSYFDLAMFVPIQTVPESSVWAETERIPLKEAAVTVDRMIPGRIAGANRRMLDIIYGELGVRKDRAPKTTSKEGPHIPHAIRTDKVRQQHTRRKAAFRASRRVVRIFDDRPVFDEIEAENAEGAIESVVRFEPFHFYRTM